MQTVDRCRDILSVITDLISFVTGSPKRLHWFKAFQEEEESVSLVKFCPTRWTLKASSLRSVLKNYRPLILFLQEVASERRESSAKASGLAKALSKFQTYFMLKLMELVFSRLETVSSAQQKRSLMLDEAKRMIKAARESISELRHSFPHFWAEGLAKASELESEEPSIPASKKTPRRYDDVSGGHVFHSTEDLYRHLYNVVDTVLSSLDDRYLADTWQHIINIEQFLARRADATYVSQFYGSDFQTERLKLHRDMLLDIARQRNENRRSEPLKTFFRCSGWRKEST
ncbi:hypothetical protein HPB48_021962 [Haemaphysalis longicornis]|uniref:Uncharacterized protein n=1 Tax=Haemaphysalis longicornis TaxID=44386 RepID=A0A9J6GBA1_HAELO|nr:hypothetical protein HPB48_021962 [Haemaphysalis longicornis]